MSAVMQFPAAARPVVVVVVVILTLLSAARAPQVMAQPAPPATSDFSLGVGYAHLSIGDDGPLDSEDALKFDPSLTFSLIPDLPQLRLGAAVGIVLVTDNTARRIVSDDGRLTVTGGGDIPLWLVEPELRLSWRQYLGDDHELFIEPGVAAGWTFARLSLDDDDTRASYDESDSTFSARAFLRFGARVPAGFAGVEASWMRGDDLDLADNARGELEEFYIGVFGALAF